MRLSLSLGAWWPEEEAPPKSLSFCHHAPEALADGSKMKRRLPGWLESLIDFNSSAFAAFEVDVPAQRGEQTLRCTQLSAQLSAELCSPGLWRYYTTLRCTESVHFLWPLNRKFSGLLVRPWISSDVADVQSLPGFLDLCLNVCSPSQVLRDVYTEVLEAAHPLHRGPTDHKRGIGPLLSSLKSTSAL